MTTQTVSLWVDKGMPGQRGLYPLEEIIPWFEERIVRARIAREKKIKPEPQESKESKTEKELKSQLLKQKYRTEELKYAERIKELMPREHVRQVFVRSAELYRTAGELLRKHHGDEAQQILLDAIEGVEKELENMFRAEDQV